MRTVYPDGRSTTVESVYDYDNQEHCVTGLEEGDAIKVKQIQRLHGRGNLVARGSRDRHLPAGNLPRQETDDGDLPEQYSPNR
jgi:hypothetical protein